MSAVSCRYWLYAAVSCNCLLVTNDEMRDHLFQLLGTSFFPRWKEKHQVSSFIGCRGNCCLLLHIAASWLILCFLNRLGYPCQDQEPIFTCPLLTRLSFRWYFTNLIYSETYLVMTYHYYLLPFSHNVCHLYYLSNYCLSHKKWHFYCPPQFRGRS